MTRAMEHCDDTVMEHCDDSFMEHCDDKCHAILGHRSWSILKRVALGHSDERRHGALW